MVSVTTKIQPIDEDVRVVISDMLSPAAQSAAFADFAEDALEDAEETDASILGYTPTHTTFVDGAESNNLDQVKPDGTIAFVFDLLDDVFAWVYEQLETHAPVKTGQFRESIRLYADGTEIDPLDDVPSASEYVFLSNVAYARKIEGGEGNNNRKPESSQAPDGVFQVVATMAAQRFGKEAKISFSYVSPADGGIVDWAHTIGARKLAVRRGGNPSHHTEWLTRVPAIVITVK